MDLELGDCVRFVREAGRRTMLTERVREYAESGEVGLVCDVAGRSIHVQLFDREGRTFALVYCTIDDVELVND